MTRLEVIARPETLEQLQDQLSDLGHNGITVTEVWGSGQPERTGRFRGSAFHIRLRQCMKVELVLPDPMVEEAIRTIRNACFTGQCGDGKIFLARIEDAVRIRTGQRSHEAL